MQFIVCRKRLKLRREHLQNGIAGFIAIGKIDGFKGFDINEKELWAFTCKQVLLIRMK
jgi:hypothetical protein